MTANAEWNASGHTELRVSLAPFLQSQPYLEQLADVVVGAVRVAELGLDDGELVPQLLDLGAAFVQLVGGVT